MNTASDIKWHTLTGADVASTLETDLENGLTGQEPAERLRIHLRNEITEKARRPLWQLIYAQFRDFMIIILLLAAIISGFIGEPLDTIAILVIVILNAAVGAIQEYRAERAIAALKAMATPNSQVLRDGDRKEIPSTELVPGDVIFLESGNIIPADIRLTDTTNLKVDEAALTGESVGVNKHTEPLTGEIQHIGELHNIVFKGTQVNRGRAMGIVIATGMNTEIGRIASLLQDTSDIKTPLQKRLTDFGKRLALVVIAICTIIFSVGLLRGEPWLLMFLTAISLAVAAIPEALPAVVSISLALGGRKMSRHQALIRNLPAVETLGSVTYICSDKTGTLTKNKMTLDHLFADNQIIDSIPQSDENLWQQLGTALAISNDVNESNDNVTGDPTEVALYEAAKNSGFNKNTLEKSFPRIDEITFDSERKRMTTIHQTDGGLTVIVKGAPESVIPLCSNILSTEKVPFDSQQLTGQAEEFAKKGYRVLAIASKTFDTLPSMEKAELIEKDLIFLALLALIDPPRDEAEQSVAECISAGIHPVMITGDHPATALAIATRLSMSSDNGSVLTGDDISSLSENQLIEQVKHTRVYARIAPEQKIRIVEALQSCGEFCAMTGDGVNDAPALKRADIGVAMGLKGTDVARESSDMILLDDNFATIVKAIREGRRIFDNIRKFIKYTMTSNAGEIWTLLLAPFLGLPIPLLPIHILWINLVTDGLPGLALAVEPAERGIMERPPRPPKENIFAHGMWQHILWVGLLIGGVSLLAQAWSIQNDSENWQTMVFTVLTFAQLANVIAIRSDKESIFTIGLLSNTVLLSAVVFTIGLQLCVIYIPFLNEVFKTSPLDAYELVICFALAALVFTGVEIEKWIVRRGYLYQ